MVAGSRKSSRSSAGLRNERAAMNPRTSPEIERLVEQITRQAMLALATEAGPSSVDGGCNCRDGQCVSECAGRVQQVIDAGAGRISAGLGAIPVDQAVAALIDHTLLKPDATEAQIAQLCYEARKYNL